jgi:hypothetical protein
VSHGCIRLLNRDIEQLFEMVKVGDVVELHTEITGQIARVFHPDAETALSAGGGGAQ